MSLVLIINHFVELLLGFPLVRQQTLSNKGRLEAVRPPVSAGPPSGERDALYSDLPLP